MLTTTADIVAQEQSANEPVPSTNVEQLLTDIEALIIATQATTRCAVYDTTLPYLTALEQVGAMLRLEELSLLLENATEDAADQTASLSAGAAEIACASPSLTPFLDFGRQIAADTIDIAMVAWRDIEIGRCAYFADDDFMTAVDRAHAAAETAQVQGAENRVQYIEQRASTWVNIFNDNCSKLSFDPVRTLPGQIALALPVQ